MGKKRVGGEGVNQMSTIVHAREGGGLRNVHVDNFLEKMCFFLLLDEDFYSFIFT